MAPARLDRLGAVINRYRNEPFSWRGHDCVLFAARCVDAQCGTKFEQSIYSDYGFYDSPLSAARLISASGGFETMISRYLKAPVEVDQLRIGDVVLARSPNLNTICLGICDEEYLIAPDFSRLAWVSMSHAIKGWKIPLKEEDQ